MKARPAQTGDLYAEQVNVTLMVGTDLAQPMAATGALDFVDRRGIGLNDVKLVLSEFIEIANNAFILGHDAALLGCIRFLDNYFANNPIKVPSAVVIMSRGSNKVT